jgi:molybdopterin converting factor small subunit
VKISIRLTAHLKRYAPSTQETLEWEMATDATTEDVVNRLAIPPDIEYALVRNGRRVDSETRLSEGDQLIFLAPITGG